MPAQRFMKLDGKHYRTGEPIRVELDGGRIQNVAPLPSAVPVEQLPTIAPGLFDLQINGYGGCWFSDEHLTADRVLQTLEPHFAFGVTRMCPTLITNSHAALLNGFQAIRTACESSEMANRLVAGCHLEGPFISAEDGPRGAHPRQHVRPANWDEFCRWQDASGGRIKLVTLAPECPDAIDFIRQAVRSDVVISIGHTAANSEEIAAAVDAGATLSTHLGNGAHGTIRRHPNYIWDQLADDRLTAGIISDGHHLPASVMKSFARVKSPKRLIVTCDASGLAGCAPGIYREAAGDVEVLEDGRIVIAGQRQLLAGSSASTNQCVARLANQTELPLADAIDCASDRPAQVLGMERPLLEPAGRGDLIQFFPRGNTLEIVSTVMAGTLRYGTVHSVS